ncbi:hypothetical protein L6Q96_15075 [Candidatus Binatia bacterium]|nr:hypothetical protein [Candidatus Binatia bacterium]
MAHQPNFENLRRTILRQGPPGPVPFFEIFADPGMVEAVLEQPFPVNLHRYLEKPLVNLGADEIEGLMRSLDMYVRFCREMGYDYVFTLTGFNLPRQLREADDTAGAQNWPGGQRYWQDEVTGPIQTWADFESYPWPQADDIRHAGLAYVGSVVPDGMKVASLMYGGIFQHCVGLMGFESFAVALHEQPDLVTAICQRVGDLATAAAEKAVGIDNVELVVLSDDLGFFSGTLVAPAVIRRHIVPHYKKLADKVHAAGKLLVLHSCGNMYALIDDLLDEVRIDGKHSFEDKILPVEEAYRRWGDRMAIMGGVDMDILGRGSQADVRRRTREILEVCAAHGTGYGLGSGNTAANYVPRGNYLAMLDEGRRWNRECFGAE